MSIVGGGATVYKDQKLDKEML